MRTFAVSRVATPSDRRGLVRWAFPGVFLKEKGAAVWLHMGALLSVSYMHMSVACRCVGRG